MISHSDVASRPGATPEGPRPPGAATDRSRLEQPAGDAVPASAATRAGDTRDATEEVLDEIYSAPLPWRVTVTSMLLGLAVLAATR